MENRPVEEKRPSNPRRRKRTNMDKFRESYLPFLIVATSVLVILAVVISLATARDDPGTTDNSRSERPLLEQAEQLLARAEAYAASYDYDAALSLLDTFDGDTLEYPEIKNAVDSYTILKNSMVQWQGSIANLSFHTLIADLDAALDDNIYGSDGSGQYNMNFITVDEFTTILHRLYDNGYILVDLDDLYEYDSELGEYVEKTLLLPADKKPILLTQTHCNYYGYMASSHAFASKMAYDGSAFYNEMTTADGKSVTGKLDFVPILEDFIRTHPSFSYKGARAILAFSGYDGIFGYRTSDSTAKTDATALVNALRETGYTIACYSYGNRSYADASIDVIRDDLTLWQTNTVPILGETEVLVFAQKGTEIGSYDGEKFSVLYENGFRYFLGSSSVLFRDTSAHYVRHSRLLVTGATLAYNSAWFDGILDTTDLLDSRRGDIPR